MTEIEKTKIESLITQWKHFSEYIKKLDTEHWYVFTIVFAAFGLFSLSGGDNSSGVICWIIPLTVTILLFYEAYRLREIAIMKGFLARIEASINNTVKKIQAKNLCTDNDPPNLFNWFYSYELVFMTNNNGANTLFPVPIIIASLALIIISMISGFRAFQDWNTRSLLIALNSILFFFDVIAIVSTKRTLRFSFAAFKDDIDSKCDDYRRYYSGKYGTFSFQELKD